MQPFLVYINYIPKIRGATSNTESFTTDYLMAESVQLIFFCHRKVGTTNTNLSQMPLPKASPMPSPTLFLASILLPQIDFLCFRIVQIDIIMFLPSSSDIRIPNAMPWDESDYKSQKIFVSNTHWARTHFQRHVYKPLHPYEEPSVSWPQTSWSTQTKF